MSLDNFFGDIFNEWSNLFNSGSFSYTDIPHFSSDTSFSVESGIDKYGEWEEVTWFDSNGKKHSTYRRNNMPPPFSVSKAIKELTDYMNKFVAKEEYEKAATIRDIVRRMKENRETLTELYRQKREAYMEGDYYTEDKIVKQIEVILNGTYETKLSDSKGTKKTSRKKSK